MPAIPVGKNAQRRRNAAVQKGYEGVFIILPRTARGKQGLKTGPLGCRMGGDKGRYFHHRRAEWRPSSPGKAMTTSSARLLLLWLITTRGTDSARRFLSHTQTFRVAVVWAAFLAKPPMPEAANAEQSPRPHFLRPLRRATREGAQFQQLRFLPDQTGNSPADSSIHIGRIRTLPLPGVLRTPQVTQFGRERTMLQRQRHISRPGSAGTWAVLIASRVSPGPRHDASRLEFFSVGARRQLQTAFPANRSRIRQSSRCRTPSAPGFRILSAPVAPYRLNSLPGVAGGTQNNRPWYQFFPLFFAAKRLLPTKPRLLRDSETYSRSSQGALICQGRSAVLGWASKQSAFSLTHPRSTSPALPRGCKSFGAHPLRPVRPAGRETLSLLPCCWSFWVVLMARATRKRHLNSSAIEMDWAAETECWLGQRGPDAPSWPKPRLKSCGAAWTKLRYFLRCSRSLGAPLTHWAKFARYCLSAAARSYTRA